jgi:hypothetical protein
MNKRLSGKVLEVIAEPEVTEPDLLSRVEAQTVGSFPNPSPANQSGAVVGIYQGRNDNGSPLVDFPLNSAGTAIVARSAVPLVDQDIGRAIVVMFDCGDVRRPIVLGLVQPPEVPDSQPANVQTMDLRVDGRRVTIEAEKEVVIKCGAASITLTRAGKVLIRGTYILSRSSGANHLKGASVEVN